MNHLAIVKVSAQSRVEKFQSYPTEAEATAHVQQVIGIFPDAYVAPQPAGTSKDWLCDVVAETAVFSPIPPPTAQEIADAKEVKATATLNTALNLTIRDALWEICQAVRGTTPLPAETKNQYTARFKASLEGNL